MPPDISFQKTLRDAGFGPLNCERQGNRSELKTIDFSSLTILMGEQIQCISFF